MLLNSHHPSLKKVTSHLCSAVSGLTGKGGALMQEASLHAKVCDYPLYLKIHNYTSVGIACLATSQWSTTAGKQLVLSLSTFK